MQELLLKPLGEMTGEEFIKLIRDTSPKENLKRYVYGIAGIQNLLNCSESKAKRLKKSGKINDAIIQDGRKIIVDTERAMELLKNQKIGR